MLTFPMVQQLLAGLPILVIVLFMLVAKWSAARAGVAGLVVACAMTWRSFGFGQRPYGEMGLLVATGGALAEAIFTAATILWIIVPALSIYHLQVRTGALEVLQRALLSVTPDPRLVAVIVAWFFALFIEGAAGFGTPVALAAPFLVSVGFQPVQAVTMALVGHAVGSSFGAVGTPILPQIAATGLSPLALSQANGLFHSLLGWVMVCLVMHLVIKSEQQPRQAQFVLWGWALLAGCFFLLPYFVLSYWVGPELPTLGGAAFGGLGFILVLRMRQRRRAPIKHQPLDRSQQQGAAILRAAAPYVLLVGLVLLTRLSPPLKQSLSSMTWEWSWRGAFRGHIQPLYHPGSMLFLALALGARWQHASSSDLKAALAKAARQLGPVTIALVAMLGVSRLMVHAGMIEHLAVAVARLAGDAWPGVAPFIGVLGTFVTGSATASNILFSDFQRITAESLGLPLLTMMAAQGFGAAVGNIICPHNIVAAGATVGLSGQEGAILRRTLWPCVIYTTLGGLLTLWLIRE